MTPDDEDDDCVFGDALGELVVGQSRPPRTYFPPLQKLLVSRASTLFGLEWKAPYWVGEAVRPFRPEGLLCAGAPPGARLVEWSVGKTLVLPMSRQPLALGVFTLIEQLDAETKERTRARPSIPTCDVGCAIRLHIIDAQGEPLGPPFEPTVWGIVPIYA